MDLETERELERMKYNATDIPTDQKQYMFQNIPSYHHKRIQRKLHTLESELQRQFEHQIQAEKERENLSRKLHLLNKKDGYHQTRSSIAKKLNDNIMTNVWKEKELVRNKQKISKLRQRQGYSRVEHVFMALDEDPIFNNVSASTIHPSNSDEGDENVRTVFV